MPTIVRSSITSRRAGGSHEARVKSVTSATTRAAGVLEMPFGKMPRLLTPNQIITSAETGLQYRIERLLGEGGFGQVYLAARLGRSSLASSIAFRCCVRMDASSTASRSSTRVMAISARACRAPPGAGRRRRHAAKSPASSKCSASCTAARHCIAISRR